MLYFAEVVHPPDLYRAIHGAREQKGIRAVDLESCDRSAMAVEHVDLCENNRIPYLHVQQILIKNPFISGKSEAV